MLYNSVHLETHALFGLILGFVFCLSFNVSKYRDYIAAVSAVWLCIDTIEHPKQYFNFAVFQRLR